MKRFCNAMGADFLVIYIPDYFQVHYKILSKDQGKLYEQKYDVNKPQRLISELCNTNGIVFIDTTPSLRQKANAERLYYDSDQHFTREGHNAVADVLADGIGFPD